MSLGQRVADDHQLARLLQIGVVIEDLVESRAQHHLDSLSPPEEPIDEDVRALLEAAVERSTDHRGRLEGIIDDLDVDPVPYEEIDDLVEATYAQTAPEDFDDLLYDQLCNEETAYKFYDDLIEAIEGSDADFELDTDRVLTVLREIREDEEGGVERVTEIMERRA
jgi:rubrerythrin